MKFTTKNVLGITMVTLMMISLVSSVAAAPEWPVKEGDKLSYEAVVEQSLEGSENEDNYKTTITTKFTMEIVKIDGADITYIYTKGEVKYEGTFDDEDDEKAFNEEMEQIVKDAEKDIEDAEEYTETDLIDGPAPLVMQSEIWEDYISDWGDMLEAQADLVKDEDDITFTYEVTETSFEYKVEMEDTTLKTTMTQEMKQEYNKDGILQEAFMSLITDVDGVIESISMSIKKSGLIPGYSVSIFLGLTAFTTLGLIAIIKRRK